MYGTMYKLFLKELKNLDGKSTPMLYGLASAKEKIQHKKYRTQRAV